MAIGKVSESDSFEVGMPAEFDNLSSFRDRVIFTTKDTTGSYDWSPIQIREANFVRSTHTSIEYSPTISFHWGNVIARQISMTPQGEFVIRNNSTNYGTLWHSGNSNIIVESGSNGNGQYLKFSNGMLIQYSKTMTMRQVTTTSNTFGLSQLLLLTPTILPVLFLLVMVLRPLGEWLILTQTLARQLSTIKT